MQPKLWIDNGGTIAIQGVIHGAGVANGLSVDGYPGVQVRGIFLGPGPSNGLWLFDKFMSTRPRRGFFFRASNR